MSAPEVTTIVPTHNRPGLLAVTLRSVLAQAAVRLSVVVVDDGSDDPDAIRNVVKRAGDDRVHLVRYRLPGGVSAARNAGAEVATGQWLAFCDDDDLWAPYKLAAQLEAARSAGAAWVYTGDVTVDEHLQVRAGAPPLPPGDLMVTLERWNAVPAGSSNVAVRADMFSQLGGFDPGLRSAGDWDLWLRLARTSTPAWVRHPLVAYRDHPGAMRANRERLFDDIAAIQRQHGNPVDWPRHQRWAAWDCLTEGRRIAATRHYGRAVAGGDVVSIARVAACWLLPYRVLALLATRGSGAGEDAWRAEAQAWLDRLRGD